MKGLHHLQELDYQHKANKYMTLPRTAIPRTKFTDRTANGLTQAVLRWLELQGHYATRINTTGRKLKDTIVVDVIGRSHITPGKWIPGTTKRGTADIHAIVNGRHISIEVKVGRDSMSGDQHKTKHAIERCGGTYLIVKTFEDFYQWYNSNLKECIWTQSKTI